MSTTVLAMPTIGEIARRLGRPVHRIEYVIRTHGITPCGWAGNARVFGEESVEVIAAELQRIDAAKQLSRGRHGTAVVAHDERRGGDT